MGKLSSYKRIMTSDYDEKDQKMVETLGKTVNDAFNDVYFTLNGRISLRDNLFCTVRDVDIIVDSSGIPTERTTFSLNNTLSVIGCQVINTTNLTNSSAYPPGAQQINFTQVNDGILINHVTGLQAGQRYTLRIIAWN